MPKDHGIGASLKRREDVRFLTGRGVYTDDMALHGQTYAVFVRSTVAHGRIKSVNTAKAAAMPGVLTGTIIAMAQALGETAPLLMIGMVAFIVDIPGSFTDAATVLPVTIFMWADSPERAFVERTSAAIMVLLAFLIARNALAVVLRKKFERRG